MAVYLIAFALCLLTSYAYVSSKEYAQYKNQITVKRKGFCITKEAVLRCAFFALAIFPIWFITAFRYDVGTDYLYTYVNFFEITQNGGAPYDEIGFQFLNSLLAHAGLGYVWLFAITGAVNVIASFHLIFKYSEKPLYSIAIYFIAAIFFNTLNNVRQYLAITIGVLALFQNRHWKAVLIILFASLFHFSALLYLAVYVAYKITFKRLGFVILSVVGLALVPILNFVLDRVLLGTKYAYFLNYSDGFSFLTLLINGVIYLLSFIFYNNRDKSFRGLANLQLVTLLLCVCSVFMQNEELWSRFIRMTAYTQLLLLPKIANNAKGTFAKTVAIATPVVLYAIYTIYVIYIIGGLEVFPYQFIF